MEDQNKPENFSPFIERVMPHASVEKKREAQGNLDAFIDVMWRICTRLEAEGYTATTLANELDEMAASQGKRGTDKPGYDQLGGDGGNGD